MTSKEFFNDGLWIYGSSIGHDHEMSFAGVPIRGVAFVATQTEAHPSKLTLCGSGSDLRGDYSLEGSIAQETGRVHLIKRYLISTPDTYLSGLMTPFGVVGVQSSSETMDRGLVLAMESCLDSGKGVSPSCMIGYQKGSRLAMVSISKGTKTTKLPIAEGV